MIIEQKPYIDENGNERENLVKHYSDKGLYIRQVETGVEYTEAVDVVPCRYTYEETETPIETADEATEQDYINALAELGVTDEENNA